jgi:DNA-binding transcriptional regulator GbsR (MarR family)
MQTILDREGKEVKLRLVQAGGKITQDLGLGRIVGRVGVHLYLTEGDVSLDGMAEELGLSKAAVSIATRQLEGLGVLQRINKPGDRRSYYRMAEHLGLALQAGMLSLVQSKMRVLGMELGNAQDAFDHSPKGILDKYMKDRVARARKACDRVEGLLNMPVLKYLLDKMG